MRVERDKRELAERNQQIAALHAQGVKLRDIAAQFGVSVVRAHQIIQRERMRKEFAAVKLIAIDNPVT